MALLGIKRKPKGDAPPVAPQLDENGEPIAVEETGKKSKVKGEKKGKNTLLSFALVLVLVLTAFFAAVVITTKVLLPPFLNDIAEKAGITKPAEDEHEEETAAFEVIASHPLDEMIVNLAKDANGQGGFLKIQISIGYGEKKPAAAFEEKKPEITDTVLTTLMSKTPSELESASRVKALKEELAKKVSALLGGTPIEIFITQYIVQ